MRVGLGPGADRVTRLRVPLIIAAMRVFILALAAIAAAPSAHAQMTCRDNGGLPEPAAVTQDQPVAGHFHRIEGKGLACAVSQDAGDAMSRHQQPVSFLPCLKIGAVAIADGRTQVEELLGEPSHVNDLDWRTEVRVYPIHQRSVPEPYYVVTYQDEVAVAVQLIGPPTEMPVSFSGLALGDSQQMVLDRLGKPDKRCVIGGARPDTWMWASFPIGVDVLDGRVVGFKVTWPAGRPTPN